MRTEAKVFWILTTLVLLAMILAAGTKASALYTLEHREWTVCESKGVAEFIADAYEEFGAQTGFDAWEAADKEDLCFVRTGSMTPIEIVIRARDLNVVKVRDNDGVDFYWVTFEPIKENLQ